MTFVLIDNYDSFTFNLVQAFAVHGMTPTVFRNDRITVDALRALRPSRLVISPGPASPHEAGISCDAVRAFAGQIPILGVCLGHQCIGEVFGGAVIESEKPMHGKCSPVYHDETGVFKNLPQPLNVMRYHSLVIDPASVPECLVVTARTKDGVIMGLRHREFCIEGVQFHPESILTPHGPELLQNFLNYRSGRWTS